ncbi:MAG: nitroreductase family protein [Ruminococcus sp.]|nr:nitroreductase family protein [Ruminococcus sp.]
MQLQDCIETRRSIRKYKTQSVDRDVIRQLIECAILAPSWKNSQVARFYAADGEKKNELAACLPPYNQNNVKDAPVLIAATVVKGKSGFEPDGSYSTHLKDGFQFFDCALQIENLCLKAHELGLGTLIMGLYDEAKVRDFLKIDDSEEVVCIISLGYPDIEPKMPKRNSVDDVLTFME